MYIICVTISFFMPELFFWDISFNGPTGNILSQRWKIIYLLLSEFQLFPWMLLLSIFAHITDYYLRINSHNGTSRSSLLTFFSLVLNCAKLCSETCPNLHFYLKFVTVPMSWASALKVMRKVVCYQHSKLFSSLSVYVRLQVDGPHYQANVHLKRKISLRELVAETIT